MLKTRTITGAGILLGTVLILLFSGEILVLKAVTALLSLLGIYEMYRATGAKKDRLFFLLSCVAAVLLCFWDIPRYVLVVGIGFGLALVIFVLLLAQWDTRKTLGKGMSALLGMLIVVFFKAMIPIRSSQGGIYTLGLAMFLCNVCDAFAYLAGKRFGKHKLAPHLSPNKTVEGSIGGMGMTVAVFLPLAYLLERFGGLSVAYGRLVVYLMLASVVSQLGDLFFSAIKRTVGIKDYGTILPGHGGILDRFDSLLFVLPFTCLYAGI